MDVEIRSLEIDMTKGAWRPIYADTIRDRAINRLPY